MSCERPQLADARQRLGRAETRLLAALVAGAAPPAGFDPVRIRAQADALVAKRRDVVTRLRPDLVRAAGPALCARFDAYARGHPRPAAGARADAEAFAQTLPPTRRTRSRFPPHAGAVAAGAVLAVVLAAGRGRAGRTPSASLPPNMARPYSAERQPQPRRFRVRELLQPFTP